MPALIDMLSDFGGELPVTTRLLVTITDGTEEHVVTILIVMAVTIGGALAYMRTQQGPGGGTSSC